MTNETELFERIFTGELNGYSEADLTAQLERYTITLAALNAKRITPASIIGSGVKSPMTTARSFCQNMIDEATTGLATRGRSVATNQANVRYHLARQTN